MRAVEITAIGGPENLKVIDRPEPTPGTGEAVVSVEAAGVGLADALVRRGGAPEIGPGHVPGLEVAGTVVAVGAGVDATWTGRRVAAVTPTGGGYAERAVVSAAALVELPEDVSTIDAVALGMNALVAEASLQRAGVTAGERVLVRGARGGIGVLTVQLASTRGATVTASVTDPSRAAELHDLGAADVVGPEPTTNGAGEGFHAVIDLVAGPDLPSFVSLLRPNGRYVIAGVSGGAPPADFGMGLFAEFQQSWTISALSLTSKPLEAPAAAFARIVEAARSGALRPVVHSVLPLEHAAAAHEELEGRGVFGKIVLATGTAAGR